MLDGDSCVPAACGVGTWGDLTVDATTVYVSADAADGGDGSAEAPLRSIQAASDLAGARGGGLVAVAAGSYTESLWFSTEHAGVELAGRCRDMVTLDASQAGPTTSGITVLMSAGELTISGLTIRGSVYDGLTIMSGTISVRDLAILDGTGAGVFAFRAGVFGTDLTLDSVEVARTADYGIVALDAGTTITIRDTLIEDVRQDGFDGFGVGLVAWAGATIEAERLEISGSAALGAIATGDGTTLSIRDSSIHGTQESTNTGYQSAGVSAGEGAEVLVERSEVFGNMGSGVTSFSGGGRLALRECVIRDNLTSGQGGDGFGLRATYGGRIEADDCEIVGNTWGGVLADDSGSSVVLQQVDVRDTFSSDAGGDGEAGGDGFGLIAMEGGRVEAEGCEVRGSTGVGIIADGTGSSMALRRVTVQDTRTDDNGQFGMGIQVTGGATLQAEACEVAWNTAVGVMVAEPGSWISLADSVVRETHADATGLSGSGVQVYGGAYLAAERCEFVDNLAVGISADDDGTVVVLQDCAVRGNYLDPVGETSCGIAVHNGATLQVVGGEIAENAELGLMVSGWGTTATLTDTVVRDTLIGVDDLWGNGALVLRGGSLRAEEVDFVRNTSVGLTISYGGAVHLIGGQVRDTLPAPDGGAGFGFQVTGGSALELEGTDVVGNTAAGVLLGHEGTRAMIRGGSITDTKCSDGEQGMVPLALAVQHGATVLAEGLLVADNEGPGFYVSGESSELHCDDCTASRNQFAGVALTEGGAITARGTTITETKASANLGGGVGVWSAATDDDVPSFAKLDECVVSGNPIAGIWLQGGGSYDISDSVISGGEGLAHGVTTRCGDAVFASDGITAWDGTSGLRLTGNVLQDAAGAGLFLDNAEARLHENTFSDNAIDVLSQGDACTGAPDGWEGSGTELLCPTLSGGYEWPICDLRFSLVLFTEDVESGGGRRIGTAATSAAPVS